MSRVSLLFTTVRRKRPLYIIGNYPSTLFFLRTEPQVWTDHLSDSTTPPPHPRLPNPTLSSDCLIDKNVSKSFKGTDLQRTKRDKGTPLKVPETYKETQKNSLKVVNYQKVTLIQFNNKYYI